MWTFCFQSIGNLRELVYLDASCNRIETLPSEIQGLESLTDLHLSKNYLQELPDTVGKWDSSLRLTRTQNVWGVKADLLWQKKKIACKLGLYFLRLRMRFEFLRHKFAINYSQKFNSCETFAAKTAITHLAHLENCAHTLCLIKNFQWLIKHNFAQLC